MVETQVPKNNNNHKKMKRFEMRIKFDLKNVILWLLIGFFALSFILSLTTPSKFLEEKPLTTVISDVKAKKVSKIEVENNNLTITLKDGSQYVSRKEAGESLVRDLSAAGVNPDLAAITIKDTSLQEGWINILSNVLPLVLMAVFFFILIRQARGAQDSIFSFGTSRAKLFNKEITKVHFGDVAGVDEAKKELEEVVDFLKNPKKYQLLGARTPKGVLLIGPSGTGKTLLAKAVAGEANVPFFSMAGSEFMEMLVGVGASRVRDLFGTAKKNAPAIIFIDEIDAIGRQRGAGIMGGHDEREQTLNQILVEMDGFLPNENVIVMAATNRPDVLDPALVRPGRFDRRVALDLPDIEGRKAILSIHQRGKPFVAEVDWDKVSKRTVGFSGADLENMLNEAAIIAASLNKKAIDMSDLEEAATKVKLGPEKKRLQSDQDRKITAYHEAGHAIVNYNLPHMDPVHRISIVSRGLTLGHTLIPPALDRTHETKSRLLEQIAAMLGGRAAEELIFKEMTSGASNDIDKATMVARAMVTEFGMSSLGPINFGPNQDVTEWGKTWYEQQSVSQQMQGKIDEEIKRIIDEGYIKAVKILKDNKKKLELVAQALLKKETIDGDEFAQMMSARP
ncbi:MAG: ATP-dependent zinc metalloprotease FtsH [Patescibacteria group bacterium]|nr:ATP-dependent zinc metalloprotease FtsH [Patescibacteria group bacterium]